ncbi:hypothetical protein Hanom_Chr09g00782641 [Helianthus anomalus]
MRGVIHRSQDLDFIQGATYQALDMSNVPDYTQYPTHLIQEPMDLVSYPRTQTLGRPRRRRRGGITKQGGPGSGVNENQNYGGNFGGIQNVGNTFDDVNLGSMHDNDRWQSILATTCNDPQYHVNDLWDFTENPLDSNNQLVDPHRSQPSFTTLASQVMSFMSDSQTDYQYFFHHQSHEDPQSR